MSYYVWLYSTVYDREEFEYDTLEEARAGYERLKLRATKFCKKDGIRRTVTLVIDSWSTEDDNMTEDL